MPKKGSRRSRPRGEVNEIISQLEHISMKDGRKPEVVQQKRDCFQKLIKYMTAGIDMSPAFVPATKCVALSKFDLPLKKMLYLYLRTAARHNSAVALLVVQTLLTDCKDMDPTIRGLAVRSMCSLRVPDLMENVYQAVDGGLKDAHPYVREAAVMGVLKCQHQDPAGAKLRGLPDRVLDMMTHDADPQVVANCLYVLEQLGGLEGVITRTLVVALLNHIRAFSDWAQCLLLEVLWRHYRPATEDERFDMLEVLDFGLNHVNSAVVMATVKLFLHYTAGYPEQYNQVLASIRGPLQTLIQGREPEVVHAVLCNVLVLAQRHPEAFIQLSPDFFCRPEDPSYLKTLKIDALVATASPSTAYDAAEEASQYARDRDTSVAQAGVRAIARIAIKVPEVDGIIDRLLLFLNHPRAAVSSQALVAMVDVLRRFPDVAEACIDAVAGVDASALTLPEGKAAFCWALGEFGDRVQDAPYVLEAMVGRFNEAEVVVKTALLTATVRLFLKRAPECKPAVSGVLTAAMKDPNTAISERAAFYHRLLSSQGLDQSSTVINAKLPLVLSFEDTLGPEVRDKIFDELNTLSVVYRAPASTFIDEDQLQLDRKNHGGSIGAGSDDDLGVMAGDGVDDGTALLLDLDGEGAGAMPSSSEGSYAAELASLDLGNTLTQPASGNGGAAPQGGGLTDIDLGGLMGLSGNTPPTLPVQSTTSNTSTSAASGMDDFLGGFMGSGAPPSGPEQLQAPTTDLGLDDYFGGLGLGTTSSTTTTPPPAAAQQQGVSLVNKPQISAAEFQQQWLAWEAGAKTFNQPLDSSAVRAIEARSFKDFVAHVGQANIASFAQPKEGSAPPYRFLLHAQREGTGSHVLAQVTVTKAPSMSVTVAKSDDAAALQHVVDALQSLLLSI